MLPDELPPYTTVYGYLPKWQRRRTWQLLHDQLRSQIRLAQGVRITIHCWDNGLSIRQDDEKKRGSLRRMMVGKKRCSAVLGRQRRQRGSPP
uniref:Transposase n=1 Tax=Moorena producens (strain JHB) TaxID=1454205 RepID=A0A1W6QDX8_MOOP1|nr:transposase [Moorena producens JHB]